MLLHVNAEAPPGYIKNEDSAAKNPPKYEYGYNIQDEKGSSHGKLETRDGIYALGRYYVQNSDSSQNVQYYADDWGYHPFIEYSNVGPHSRTKTQLLLGVEAVKALASNKFTPNSLPAKQHVTDIINSKINNRDGKQAGQPQLVVAQQNHQTLVEVQQPQEVVNEQPQQIVVEHQPQNQQIIVERPQHILLDEQQQQQQQISEQQQQQQISEQQQQQQISEQPQQTPVDDSITVEAISNRQAQLQEQPQLNHVLTQQEISFQQSNFNQPKSEPQIEEIQIREGISHQQIPVPQAQSLPKENDKQIQDNLVFGGNYQQSHSNLGGFGSQHNLLGRRPPNNINRQLQQTSGRLIETTKNLVSGQDVLNINSAIDQSVETSVESSTVNSPFESASLLQEPIVVADDLEQVKENVFSTTSSTIETISTKSFGVTEPSTLLVTPRPVSTNFLAPITAGIQLTNIKNTDCNQDSESSQKIESTARKENYVVEIQKSLPYYLGKYEYGSSAVEGDTQSQSGNLEGIAVENIELGKTLLALPGQPTLNQNNLQQQQQLPQVSIKENFVDQQQAQGNHQVKVVTVPVIQTKIVEKPVQVTKYIQTPYPVPVEIRVPIEKHIPVTVEKIVEKKVHVPQPYPVEKIVEKHVPVEVTRFIDRPYPVQVPVATPVPYPVDRVVEKIVKQPYPVEVRVPVPVEKIVEKKVSVPVDRIVEKPVPQFIDRPVQVQVPVPVAQIYTLQLSKALPPILKPPQQTQSSQKISVTLRNLNNYRQQNQPLFVQVPNNNNNGYLPPHNCDQHSSYSSNTNSYYTIQADDYIGLLPPRLQDDEGPTKFRNPRSNFNSNLRLEYGFMPPLRPSQEIDEHGNPITREKP
nr:PREDICTED: alpha-protein kinase 1 isoform X2 [Tribolium castaneum]|eukprot:XP_015840116.1 PREDICTED: alpha-protein kinase 1 isoform X2 [Tribolium castaneum]